jgi:AraC family transcriptional regulator
MAFMRAHLRDELSRETVATHAGLSVSHFSHLLRQKVGRSFSDLLRQYRVDRAGELLRRGSLELAQVAVECGFCDQSHFTRVFRRYTGASPRQYRLGPRPQPTV